MRSICAAFVKQFCDTPTSLALGAMAAGGLFFVSENPPIGSGGKLQWIPTWLGSSSIVLVYLVALSLRFLAKRSHVCEEYSNRQNPGLRIE